MQHCTYEDLIKIQINACVVLFLCIFSSRTDFCNTDFVKCNLKVLYRCHIRNCWPETHLRRVGRPVRSSVIQN
jgi:hypothetical protein